ncbi:hypothetical protein [Mycobacterium sp. NAZ190054]|uniref:hypothetical protein n=1 Tax=Mycobacterium sp. NAZ190054 TaxID=1747766 RepID=UPI000A847A65|nr:hypothetical protein [Mycobacterium sp. NAZ190054]
MRVIAFFAVLIGIGAFTGVWAVMWLLGGSYLTALIVFLMTVWAYGFALYFLVTSQGRAQPRTEIGADGTLLRPARFVDTILIASASAVFLAAALYLVFAPLGLVDYVPSGVMRVMVPAGCACMVLLGVPTVYRMIQHRSGGHLRLHPGGFEIWNGQWGSFRTGTWDDIGEILDHPPKGEKPFNKVIVVVLHGGRNAMLIADAITDDSRALQEWVQFYWQHPEYRDELVDARALRRLDEARFTPE